MAIFDINNPPALPDSNLDPDLTLEQSLSIGTDALDGTTQTVSIAPGDWADVSPAALTPDPNWGNSFQVSNLYPTAVGVLVSGDGGMTYYETQVSFSWITNNFRRMPTT